MATAQPLSEMRLQIRRKFAAPRAEVFDAWTKKEQLERWMCRDNPKNDPRYTQFDLRPGGTNLMEIMTTDGNLYKQRVAFREVTPPEKLVFTWAWQRFLPSGQKDEEAAETVVTVEFHERDQSTELVLTHEFFKNAEQRDRHANGWNGCLDVLELVLEE